ncbi:oligopeptide transport system substrate-binding protein [Dongia mobilis]|uniref:Oligopeptide transport system substrate-binding protein n=1 Tax=Dongia mobilis TaxID=578943 RepID=A0A4R6WVJ7_9PROT|nr:peptide ABC transporter substrate-binding protein [Dongia mobilis]TDQ84044.1 oligopeptide transport system substrate-binding protein [Dongia mobilis]
MKLSIRKLLLPAVAACALLASVSFAEAEMVFHRGNGAEPETINPHKSTGVTEANIEADLFEGLTSYAANGELIPGVAESWEISDDGKTYTFKLRQNAKWSNGDPVTAADFVFGLQDAVNPNTAADYAPILDVIVNAQAIREDTEKDLSKLGVVALDDHTLQITLNGPTPYFLGLLRHPIAYPVHKATVETFGDDWTKPGNMVSNGAYMLTEWTPQASLTYVKNPHYWDAANVKVDKVVMYPTEDLAEELKSYKAGELHATYDVPSEQIKDLEANYADEFKNTLYLGTYYYVINLTKEPLGAQSDLRKALSLAINREILTEKITQGGEAPAYSWVPPMTGYSQAYVSFKDMPQDDRVALAKELLAKHGYGPDNPLNIELLYNTSENHKKIAVAAQSMWKAIGVNATLRNEEWKVYLETRDKKNFEVARAAWIADYDDPINFLDMFLSNAGERNDAGYNNKDYDELIAKTATETDPAARMKLFTEAEQLFLNDDPMIPIYHYTSQHMVSTKVSGWEANILDFHLARYISIAE